MSRVLSDSQHVAYDRTGPMCHMRRRGLRHSLAMECGVLFFEDKCVGPFVPSVEQVLSSSAGPPICSLFVISSLCTGRGCVARTG